ncbi:hypothetical protein HDU87_002641 [Geranomyces variabilis]|uniref:HTH APSES-type domain-containing protein n=1 Tax=Geranomyces variabilis TaxID=109894 RepID=A0AAD5XTW0_9FUNG|nr:hypothetical protein HDU87_002641 [Geranomyces variabilis]
MAPERKQARKDKLVDQWNAKTQEEKQQHSDKISRGQASMSAEAVTKRDEARRRAREQKDAEELQRMHTDIGQKSAATWATRDAEDKTKHGEAISAGKALSKLLDAEDLKDAIYKRERNGGEITLEIAFPTGPIMRRSDGWVNVSKLFSVLETAAYAATSWAKRQTCTVKSVSSGTLVGKWVSADDAARFAERRGITADLAPLLAVDMRPEIIEAFPTKDEILAKLPGGGQNAQRIKQRDREQGRADTQSYRERKRRR